MWELSSGVKSSTCLWGKGCAAHIRPVYGTHAYYSLENVDSCTSVGDLDEVDGINRRNSRTVKKK